MISLEKKEINLVSKLLFVLRLFVLFGFIDCGMIVEELNEMEGNESGSEVL